MLVNKTCICLPTVTILPHYHLHPHSIQVKEMKKNGVNKMICKISKVLTPSNIQSCRLTVCLILIWSNIIVRVWLICGPCFSSLGTAKCSNFQLVIELGCLWKERGAPAKAWCGLHWPDGSSGLMMQRSLLWPFWARLAYRMRSTKNNSLFVVAVTYTCEYRRTTMMSSQMLCCICQNWTHWGL